MACSYSCCTAVGNKGSLNNVTTSPALVDTAGESVEATKEDSIDTNSRGEAQEVQKLEYEEKITTLEKELKKVQEKAETAAAIHNMVTEKL